MSNSTDINWFDLSCKYHRMTFGLKDDLLMLPDDNQRELAALWRLEADVNNGGYIQFIGNWGRVSYEYASNSLRKIEAHQMLKIIEKCQIIVDQHVKGKASYTEIKKSLPTKSYEKIMDLSYQFMRYPDSIEELGMKYYVNRLKMS